MLFASRTSASGRDYRVEDLGVLWPLGTGAALCAAVVFGLFVSSPEVRARYAEAIAYIKALAKLRRDSPPDNNEIIDAFESWFTSTDDLNNARKYGRWYLRRALPTPGQPAFNEGKAQAFMELLSSRELEHHYKAYLWLCANPSTPIETLLDGALMQTHRHEWLKEKVHEPGKKAIDRYAWVMAHDMQAALTPSEQGVREPRSPGCYGNYEFHQVAQRLQSFCSEDLGGFYLDILKARLYTAPTQGRARRSARTSCRA